MDVLRRYEYRVVKAPEAGALFERLLDGVGPAAASRARFWLSEGPGKISPIDRALKKFPELAPFQLSLPSDATDITPSRFLTNFERHHAAPPEPGFVTAETLLEVVRGIPRSYPFFATELSFVDDIPGFAGRAAVEDFPAVKYFSLFGERVPHFSLNVNWGASSYTALVHAAIPLGSAETLGTAIPKLPEPLEAFLGSLGKVANTLLLTRPTAAESAASESTNAELGALFLEWKKRIRDEMRALKLPHELPPAGTGTQMSPLTVAHKPTLIQAFKPLGYSYISKESGHGTFTLAKRTPNNNRVTLSFDMGSIWRHYTGGLTVTGAAGRCYVKLPAHPDQVGTSYDVGNDEAWEKVLGNVSALVEHLERTFVPQVEQLLGRTPDWYEW